MSDNTDADLRRRIQTLESENALLRAQTEAPGPRSANAGSGARGGWGRTLLATVLIVVGAVLAPAAVASSWSKALLTDTERFVANYAPLADDPAVQAYVSEAAVSAINEHVDVAALTADVIDGITALGTGPRATQALNLLKGPAASGVQTLLHNGVSGFVESDAFAAVWTTALRVSHTQLLAAMDDDPGSVLVLDGDGSVGIALGPIVDAAKGALADQGIDLAARIPEIDRTIVVAQSDAVPGIRVGYRAAVTLGDWLPWASLALLVTGVLVARRRPVALVGAAIGLALAMGATLAAFAVGSMLFIGSVSPTMLPSGVAGLLYGTVVEDMRATAVVVLVLGVAVAIVGWLAGPFDGPRRVRALVSAAADRLREAAEPRGVTTGRVGEWFFAQRTLMRALIAVVGAAIVLFIRPLTPGLVLWTVVGGTIAVLVLEIVQRPAREPEAAPLEPEAAPSASLTPPV
jgi:hypothetical protein